MSQCSRYEQSCCGIIINSGDIKFKVKVKSSGETFAQQQDIIKLIVTVPTVPGL